MAYYFPPQQKPQRWGNFQSVQYAIRKNSEKIFGVDPDSNVLNIPGFWGLPALDYSKYNNHGTSYQWDRGIVNNNTGRLEVSHSPVLGASGLSYSVLILHDGITLDTWGGIYCKRTNAAGDDAQYSLQRYLSSGYVNVYHGSISSVSLLSVTTSLLANAGYLGIVFDRSGIDAYNDGKLIERASFGTAVPAGDGSLLLGRERTDIATYSADYICKIFSVYNSILTAEQIALFYARKWDLYRRVGRTYYSIAAAPSIYIPQIMIF